MKRVNNRSISAKGVRSTMLDRIMSICLVVPLLTSISIILIDNNLFDNFQYQYTGDRRTFLVLLGSVESPKENRRHQKSNPTAGKSRGGPIPGPAQASIGCCFVSADPFCARNGIRWLSNSSRYTMPRREVHMPGRDFDMLTCKNGRVEFA